MLRLVQKRMSLRKKPKKETTPKDEGTSKKEGKTETDSEPRKLFAHTTYNENRNLHI